MNEFYIYFFGLICHVGRTAATKQFAAMVKDDDHFYAVFFERGKHEIPLSKSIRFKLDGMFSSADVHTTDSFHQFVPSLQSLMGGNPRINIGNYASLVYYPASEDASGGPIGSEIAVTNVYEKQGWYFLLADPKWGPGCVARLTEVKVVTSASQLEVINILPDDSEEQIGSPITPGECVVIANMTSDGRPKIFSSAHSSHAAQLHAGHAALYRKILIDEDNRIVVRKVERPCEQPVESEHCPWVREAIETWRDKYEILSATDLECGNTNWP